MSRTLHQLNSRITGMICPRCQKRYPVGDYFFGCPACLERGASSNLTLVYEGKAQIQKDATGWHRYRDFLPYDDTVSLGEGFTPVRTFPRLAKELGFRKLYTKHEFQNPTGSHKDRMNPFITARAREAGYSTVTCASSGNEAASLAAYAAAEGLNCVNVSTRFHPFSLEKCFRRHRSGTGTYRYACCAPFLSERTACPRKRLVSCYQSAGYSLRQLSLRN